MHGAMQTQLVGPGYGRNLDQCRIPNAQLKAFMRGCNLICAQVDCGQQVSWSGGYDGPEAIHLHNTKGKQSVKQSIR